MHSSTGHFRWVAFVTLALAVACGDNRGGDVPRIRGMLEALPGVRVLDVVGFDEMWPFFGPEAIRADMDVENEGRLSLCDLSVSALTGAKPYLIARVGDWVPLVRAEIDEGRVRYVAGCPDSVLVSADSPFAELVPFPIASVTDVVSNFPQLRRVVESWPQTPVRARSRRGAGWIEYRKARYR